MESVYSDFVKFLDEYCSYTKEDVELFESFDNIIEILGVKKVTPPNWLNGLISKYKYTDKYDEKDIDDDYISISELRYNISNTLYELQKNNMYTDIILKDYSKYFE